MIRLFLPAALRTTRAFQVSERARRRLGVDASPVDVRGRALTLRPDVAEQLARSLREETGAAVGAADVMAAGALDEAAHLLLSAYRRDVDPEWGRRVHERLRRACGPEGAEAALRDFVTHFPPLPVARGLQSAGAYLDEATDGTPNREVVLEEWACLEVARDNPALEPLRLLFDVPEFDARHAEARVALRHALEGMPAWPAPDGEAGVRETWPLAAWLRAPVEAAPGSLEAQLRFVQVRWGELLGTDFAPFWTQVLRVEDRLREAQAGAPPGPPDAPAPVLSGGLPESVGEAEEVRYAPDAAWMARAVLVAKSTYVWLDQLARRFERPVNRLDEIPDEALAELRRFGFDALWLIGVWERSPASRRIKRRRGQEDAVASAYAVFDYVIAEDLGGEAGFEDLRARAAAHGLRLAADMVPNHVGIDGRWVLEHPERFLQLEAPPYPGYTFEGPDLAEHDRVEVRIEDGYWDHSDAAVVFERRDRATGEARYLYHGNDGTSTPWNDTAQLDFLSEGTREAVLDTIVEVARRFPIIRFDAAMTLARRHVRRLWYPPPGEGGAIPSRSEHGHLEEGAFERRMPQEFWHQVVERVEREAPDTLLLAEAFWMMEGYFVRTLGMHRVYNSAFMNMLAREANADYRASMTNVLSFDPRILERFVNFMNNPDEETAVAQFGEGDKAFGVTTLLATLPGLPMFGHGQVEGLREKYGMEYRRALLDETPNVGMVERHARDIAPLLRRRGEFARADRFRLFDVEDDSGAVLEDVFAYATGTAEITHLVLYHNREATVEGHVRRSVPFVPPDGGPPQRVTLAEALGVAGATDRDLVLREARTGSEARTASAQVHREGLPVRLGPYEARVYLDLREAPREAEAPPAQATPAAPPARPAGEDAPAPRDPQAVRSALAAWIDRATPEAGPETWARVLERAVPDAAPPPRRAARAHRRRRALAPEAAGITPPPRAWREAVAAAALLDRPKERWRDWDLGEVVRTGLPARTSGAGADAWVALLEAWLPSRAEGHVDAHDALTGPAARAFLGADAGRYGGERLGVMLDAWRCLVRSFGAQGPWVRAVMARARSAHEAAEGDWEAWRSALRDAPAPAAWRGRGRC